MKSLKRMMALSIVTLGLLGTSMTVFASPSNPGVPAKDGSGRKHGTTEKTGKQDGTGRGSGAAGETGTHDGTGRGNGGEGRGEGIGGMRLHDGSCYTAE